jgi:hypothetical protein
MDNFNKVVILTPEEFEQYLKKYLLLTLEEKYEYNIDRLYLYEMSSKSKFIYISHKDKTICISGTEGGE